MIQRDYLIIGSGIGGASACEGIRRHDKRGSVTLIGAEAFPPYKRWILSKSFLREKDPQLKKLQEPDERWYHAHKIETRFGTVVTQFNIDRRLAVLANGESIEFNKACLAMGSRPVRPPVAGTGLGNVIYLRTLRDALALKEMANLEKSLMVVGGGLLACEAAASLRMMKLKVGLMHRDSYLLNRYLDAETGTWLTDYFAKHGVAMSMGEISMVLRARPSCAISRQKAAIGSPLVWLLSPAAQNRISIWCAIRRWPDHMDRRSRTILRPKKRESMRSGTWHFIRTD